MIRLELRLSRAYNTFRMPDLYKSNETPAEEVVTKEEKGVAEERPIAKALRPEASEKRLWSFYVKPNGVHFETQDPQEEIILLLRKHPVTNLWWIFVALLLLIAPSFFDSYSFLPFLPRGFHFVASLLWYLVTAAFILENFLSWFFNVYIVTDERIIDVDFHNLIYREISETKIDKIQDVTFSMGGVMSAFFNYGNVVIQTAGTVPNFDFQAVPEPSTVVKILQQLRTEEEQEAIEGRVR